MAKVNTTSFYFIVGCFLILPASVTNVILLFVGHDESTYHGAVSACFRLGGKLARVSDLTHDEKLDVMSCIPHKVIFWSNQRGSRDACLITTDIDFECFTEIRSTEHGFLCSIKPSNKGYDYYSNFGDICGLPQTTLMTNPVSTTKSATLTPTTEQYTTSINPTSETNNVTVIMNMKENGDRGASAGLVAGVLVFIFIISVVSGGMTFLYLRRRRPEVLQKMKFWEKPSNDANEYDSVSGQGNTIPEHSYAHLQMSTPADDYYVEPITSQRNGRTIPQRNIDNIDYLVVSPDNIIKNTHSYSNVDDNTSHTTCCAQNDLYDYDYIHVSELGAGANAKPTNNIVNRPESFTYDLARGHVKAEDETKCKKAETDSGSHGYSNEYTQNPCDIKVNLRNETEADSTSNTTTNRVQNLIAKLQSQNCSDS